ncbi:ankyrin repeat domain-containing protein [Deltaproteobacteria bacterium TL4]
MLKQKEILVLSLIMVFAGCLGTSPEDALNRAARDGNLGSLTRLLSEGVNIEGKDDQGNSPLINAAEQGHTEIVHFLMTHGSDVNAKGKNGITALRAAIYNNHADVIMLLTSDSRLAESPETVVKKATKTLSDKEAVLIVKVHSDTLKGAKVLSNGEEMGSMKGEDTQSFIVKANTPYQLQLKTDTYQTDTQTVTLRPKEEKEVIFRKMIKIAE